LRERILRTIDEGKTQIEAALLFKVSETTVKRYVRRRREEGHVQPRPIPGRPPSKRAPLEAKLQPQLENLPDATLQELCNTWEAQEGIKVSISTMSRALERLNWTRKKKDWQPEGEIEDLEDLEARDEDQASLTDIDC
jgi:transposase